MAHILSLVSTGCVSLVASKVWNNFGQLVSGRLVSSMLTFAATVIMARSLGPAEFGGVVILHTYVVVARALVNFKPAEAFVRFGVPLIDDDDRDSIADLLGVVRVIEWLSTLFATVLAVCAAPLIGPWLGWSDETIVIAMLYSLVLLGSAIGTARGLCRALERFDILRTQLAVGPIVRLLGVALAWYFAASWHYFALAWGVSLLASYVYLRWQGKKLLRENGFCPRHISLRHARERFPGLQSFMGVVYVQGNLDQLPRHLVTLLLGSFLGNAAAGLYRIARELADILAKPVQLIRQAAFTELTRVALNDPPGLLARVMRDSFKLLIPGVVLVGIGILWGDRVLEVVAGEEYGNAYLLFVLLLGAAGIELLGALLRPLAYVLGRANRALTVQVITTGVYLSGFLALYSSWGVDAVGIAACVAAVLGVLLMMVVVSVSSGSSHEGR